MTTEFQKVGPNSAISDKGFSEVLHPSGGVEYSDSSGKIHVDSELLVKPLGVLLYPQSGQLKVMPTDRAEEVLKNVVRALEYLGHRLKGGR